MRRGIGWSRRVARTGHGGPRYDTGHREGTQVRVPGPVGRLLACTPPKVAMDRSKRRQVCVLAAACLSTAGCGGSLAGPGGPGSGDGGSGSEAAPDASSDDGTRSTPTPVAAKIGVVAGLAVDAQHLFWIDGNQSSVQFCDKNRCPSTIGTLATNQANPADLAIDSANAYWTNSGSPSGGGVMACPLAACQSPSLLATSSSHPTALKVGSTGEVYWIEDDYQSKGVLMRVPAAGGPSTILWQITGRPSALAIDDTSAYVATDDGTVWKCSQNGCDSAPTVLARGQGYVAAIVLSGGSVYWAARDQSSVRACAVGGCNENPGTVASMQNHPVGMAVLGSALFWTNVASALTHPQTTDGEIARWSASRTTVLAGGQAGPGPIAADVSSTALYWANNGGVGGVGQVGTILRLAL